MFFGINWNNFGSTISARETTFNQQDLDQLNNEIRSQMGFRDIYEAIREWLDIKNYSSSHVGGYWRVGFFWPVYARIINENLDTRFYSCIIEHHRDFKNLNSFKFINNNTSIIKNVY